MRRKPRAPSGKKNILQDFTEENVWASEAAKQDLFKGELAVINNQPSEVDAAKARLAAAPEPMWVERLTAFQARFHWLVSVGNSTWRAPETGGEKYGHLAGKYLESLKTVRLVEFLTVQPSMVSGNQPVAVREQIKSLQLPQTLIGWQRAGKTQSIWKMEKGSLFLWNAPGRSWAEVRDPEVRERVMKGSVLDTWVDLLNHQIPKESRESTDGQADRVQLVFETPDYEPSQVWGETTNFWIPSDPAGNSKVFLRVTVELSKLDGRVDHISVEFPDASAGRTYRIEKIFFDQNFIP